MTGQVDVVWVSDNPEAISRGYWDEAVFEAIFDGSLWRPPQSVGFVHRSSFDDVVDGAVVVVPARWHVDKAAWLNSHLRHLRWAVVVLAGDEEGVFPQGRLNHEAMAVWTQTPMVGHAHGQYRGRLIGDFWPPAARGVLAGCDDEAASRPLDWFFAGQLNNERRQECLDALRGLPGGQYRVTKQFGAGFDYGTYLHKVASAKVAPCPSGTFTPDTFRLYEALEAGCVPVVDASAPKGSGPGYWEFLFDRRPPFPVVDDWADIGEVVGLVVADWKRMANRCFGWWQTYKRSVAWWMHDDIARLREFRPRPASADEQITVLIPTSCIPSHPDTAIIEETVGSVRDRLPHAEVVVMVDGLRAEQQERHTAYEEYVRRLLWLTNYRWHNVVPLVFDAYTHQAQMTREALRLVRTEAVLFVEHDTPLVGDVDFDGIVASLHTGAANLVRLSHEASILEPHRHLFLDRDPQYVAGTPMVRTVQWSQRPHVATTDFYGWLIDRYFGARARTMIEDVVYGAVINEWGQQGMAGWDMFKLWVYAPDGDIKRSTHLDGRGTDPKYPMTWAYDGPTPPGAPNPRSSDED